MISLEWYADSIPGLRAKNDDSYLAMKVGEYYLFIVADGLGGHPAGNEASAIAISSFEKRAKTPVGDGKEFLLDALAEAQVAILKVGPENPELMGMGTTLLAVLVNPDGTGLFMNVGDSRGHLINGGITHTHDQNMSQALVRAGRLTEEQAMNHPLSKVLKQALGDIEPPVPDFYPFDMNGKYLLLSSDGLHGFVMKDRIREIVIAEEQPLSGKVVLLIDEALRSGSDDNITVILAREVE